MSIIITYYEIQKAINSTFEYHVMERKSLEQKRKEFLNRIEKEKKRKGDHENGSK